MPDPSRPGASYREVTISAIAFAIVIGAIMNAAITYAGLKIGFTIGGSAIAAVLGFGVLRGVFRLFNPQAGSILETNIAQTAASAINTSNSGVIFTVPVLLLIGVPLAATQAEFWLITLACIGGAVLGAAFIIPLRKQMIDVDRLRFPTGTGVAVILKSPGAGAKKAVVLVIGIIVGALIYLPVGLPQLGEAFNNEALQNFSYSSLGNAIFGAGQHVIEGEDVNAGALFGIPPYFELLFAIAPFALGAGYITGRPGLLVLAGGILAYFVLTPAAYLSGWMPETVAADAAPDWGFQAFNRPLGIGLLLGGAMMGVLVSLPSIVAALKSVAAASKLKSGADELSLKPLVVAAVGAFIMLFFAADYVGGRALNETKGHVCPVTAVPVSTQFYEKEAAALPEEERAAFRTEMIGVVAALDTAEREFQGYNILFASEDAAVEWDAWPTEKKDEYLASLNAKPGWFAGLPHHLSSALIALIGTLWIWFAGIIIAQCTGMTDWSPISGMALITVVLVMMLAGTGAVVGAVLIGAALCVAITLAADMMQDLRTGHLVGAKPRRQQIVELSVVWIGPAITMFTILIIASANLKSYGVAIGPETPTAAPQAQALQAVITGVQGGEMPYALYGFGALLGALLGLGAFSGLGVLVGLSMYLPFHYIATYGIGCIVQMVLSKTKGRQWSEDWGVPCAAGLIVGESMLALIFNMIIVIPWEKL